MKKNLTLLLLLPFLSIAQIGINTVSPKAALDVQSTNNGVLIPRVLLIDALDILTVVNPAGGILEKSTLVYNFNTSGVAPDNVTDGFYYWNGVRWIPIAGNTISDHDWYEEGTTTSPNAITDDMFHSGNMAIGKITADYPLEVNTTNFQFGTYNTLNNPSTTSQQKATLVNDIFDSTNDPKYGVINKVNNNSITSGGIGVRNEINGDGTTFFGNSNYLTAGGSSNGADIIGVRNSISSDSNNSYLRGSYSIFDGTGGNLNQVHGALNDFRATAMRKTGTENVFNPNVDGFNIGMYNSLATNLAFNDQYGVWNNFTTGAVNISDNYGLYNYFSGDGNGRKIGSYTRIDANGDGQHIGTFQQIDGSAAGIGTKYGTQTQISSTTGGTHYGIHSTVLKPGATNFAGYFLGNVGVGTTTFNTYTLPASRGTNGQIMQTDGIGNVTWQNPNTSAWELNGNAVTNPPTTIDLPIAVNENFIGTTDYEDLVLGANNYSRMKISAFGNIGIGTDNPNAKFHVNDNNSPYIASWITKTNLSGGTLSGYVSPTLVVSTNSTNGGTNERYNNAEFFASGANSATNIAASFYATGGANNYAILVPQNSGNVGFGTNTPSTKLHIENTSAGALRIVDGTQAAGRVLTSNATGVATWQTPSAITAWSLNGNTAITTPTNPATYGTSTIGATENFIGTTDNNDFTIGTNSVERMRVKNTTGNIGIGTANPSSILEVVGTGTAEMKLSSRDAFGPTRFSMISDKELPDEWRPTFIESADNGSFTGRMDFFTNGTGIANKFGSLRAMSITNGKVGVGTINPTEKIHVFDNSNVTKSSIFSEARQIATGIDYDNTAIKGYGRAMPFWGFGNGVMGIGDPANSYFATGVYAHLGTTAPTLPSSNQALYANGNGLGHSGIFSGGNVGIGAANPSRLLHINSATNGALRIVDGTQAANKVLTSDATGVATWRDSALTGVDGTLFPAGAGIAIPYNTSIFLQSNAYITLPPGTYVVNVTMLMSVSPANSFTTNNSSFWLRSAFSDSGLPNPARTMDTVGNYYISGNLPGSSSFSILSGSVIINNNSGGNKTYYYIVGQTYVNNTTQSLGNFGGWGEDSIVAYRIN